MFVTTLERYNVERARRRCSVLFPRGTEGEIVKLWSASARKAGNDGHFKLVQLQDIPCYFLLIRS